MITATLFPVNCMSLYLSVNVAAVKKVSEFDFAGGTVESATPN
jgi:hypothetical protein